MTVHVGVGGAWKNLVTAHIGVSGAWKALQTIHIGVGGAWKALWTAINAQSASASDGALDPANAAASVTFKSDGTVTYVGDSGTAFTLIEGGSAAAFEVRIVVTGDAPTGMTSGTWYALTSDRTASFSQTVVGTKSCSGTYEVGLAGTNTAIASASFSLLAVVDV